MQRKGRLYKKFTTNLNQDRTFLGKWWRFLALDLIQNVSSRKLTFSFFTIRNKLAKVMFLHLFVSHSVHRGVLPQCMMGYHTPLGPGTPKSRPPGPGTPMSPPEQTHPLGPGAPRADGYCCGRYASYWNAFLFLNVCPFCGPLVLDFREWAVLFMLGRGICVTHSQIITSDATPADLLAGSKAVEPFSSMYLQAGIGGVRNRDLSCHHCLTVWDQADAPPTELCQLTFPLTSSLQG